MEAPRSDIDGAEIGGAGVGGAGAGIAARAERFFATRILPRHADWVAATQAGERMPAFVATLREEARAEGLWNLGIPPRAGSGGPGLSNRDFAPIAELTGRLPWASLVFNCHAPDLPNMIMLDALATPGQRERFLVPLLEGRAASAFAMTEPDVASSDATNIATTIRADGGDLVVSGRKWFITGAAAPDLSFHIVMGVTDPEAPRTARHSAVLVPADAPGIRVERTLRFLGWDDHVAPIGEIVFDEVRVSAANMLGEPGRGFDAAQVRLGPARLHHAFRCIGLAEMLLDLMKRRMRERTAFGRSLAEYDSVQQWIAEGRIGIDMSRHFLNHAAAELDANGFKASWRAISMAKVHVPRMLQEIADRALQLFGAAGGSDDHLIHHAFVYARMFRIADGPDEVHLRQIFRSEPVPEGALQDSGYVARRAAGHPNDNKTGRTQ
ncbi:acyl-CoA dehydrogenase [Acuticoccus sediminis]|uniref:Acyl-CoA dehydrogenase n=1 Tax=Acuticoccus sediminis TaxID=2184697 RepID=A0A8B2NSU6_9HYPH|nr:acyl-CoA dehydrogenase family protein [Acuticoccus sediminis]RAI00182.1 acyl-CoA dehydrogenase [Acuticoccus sediminis]